MVGIISALLYAALPVKTSISVDAWHGNSIMIGFFRVLANDAPILVQYVLCLLSLHVVRTHTDHVLCVHLCLVNASSFTSLTQLAPDDTVSDKPNPDIRFVFTSAKVD